MYLTDVLPDTCDFEVNAAYPESPDPDAFATDTDTALVHTLPEASGGDIRPFEAATEASYFADTAPTVIFGPGVLADEHGPVAHADREYIHQSDITAAANAVRDTVETLLR